MSIHYYVERKFWFQLDQTYNLSPTCQNHQRVSGTHVFMKHPHAVYACYYIINVIS